MFIKELSTFDNCDSLFEMSRITNISNKEIPNHVMYSFARNHGFVARAFGNIAEYPYWNGIKVLDGSEDPPPFSTRFSEKAEKQKFFISNIVDFIFIKGYGISKRVQYEDNMFKIRYYES